MNKYKINIIFNEDSISLEDIFTRVLLKELLMVLKNENKVVVSSCAYLSLNKEGEQN